MTREKALRDCPAAIRSKKPRVVAWRHGRARWIQCTATLSAARRSIAKLSAEVRWRTRLRSSPALTSRRRCRPVSMPRWSRSACSSAAGATGGEQVFGVDPLGGAFHAVHAPGQPGGLDEGEVHRLRRGGEGDQAAGFGAATIALAGLDGGRLDRRGKKRATDSGGVVARCRPRPSGCL